MISQYEPWYSEETKKKLKEFIDTDTWFSEFEKTEEFEKAIAKEAKTKFCSTVNNGTVAISIALQALGVGANDEVIVPDLTMIATANAVSFIGAIPVFCDIDERTNCLDIHKAIDLVTDDTKAIVYVTLNGRIDSQAIMELKNFCDIRGIILIKDDAQSFGSESNEDKSVHSSDYSIVSTLSFSPHKIISCGQGGAILTDDEEIYKDIERHKDFGRLSGGADVHEYFGINSKFTDLQAVLGLAQMELFKNKTLFKKMIYDDYYKKLCAIKGIRMIERQNNHVPWFVDIYLESEDKRNKLMLFLKENKIQTRKMYPVISGEGCYNLFDDNEIAKKVSRTGLWLPSSFTLKPEELDFVCQKVGEFYNVS